jgi:uroporphyrinogen-III synthase
MAGSAFRPLQGVRVGLLQTRYGHELASLVERLGAVPVQAPCMREVRNDGDEELDRSLRSLVAEPVHVFVFQTGVGAQALFELAGEAGLGEPLAGAVREAVVVARGPKPLTVLLQLGFEVDLRTAGPHTTGELVRLLEDVDVAGRRVAVQHYGSANAELVRHLAERGAEVIELFSYRWALPEDVTPVLHLLGELRAGRLGVTAFTSAAQVENLFAVAAEAGMAGELPGWLNGRTVTAAIGPTCARALDRRGVAVVIQPERPKMVPFVRAIGDHYTTGSSAMRAAAGRRAPPRR